MDDSFLPDLIFKGGTLHAVTFKDFAHYPDEKGTRYSWQDYARVAPRTPLPVEQGCSPSIEWRCLLCGRPITHPVGMCRSHRSYWKGMSPTQRARTLAKRVLELYRDGASRDTVVWSRGLCPRKDRGL